MKRVVVTGLGIVSPLGIGESENWVALTQGRSGIGPITRFDASGFRSRIAGEVKGFDPTLFMEPKEVKKVDLFVQYALAAGEMAVASARFEARNGLAQRFGVCVGSGIGGLRLIEETARVLRESGPRRISPFFIPGVIVNMASGMLSIRFGAKGPNLSLATACATGTHAIGEAFRTIRHGSALAMLAGGAEAAITPLALGGFAAMKALSTRNDEPARASRPFDLGRDGFVIGEGAGVLLLEERESAGKRGAPILAEVLGYGLSADAYHMTTPDPDGDGAARCMSLALLDAAVAPERVGYVNAHGTSTQYNDANEARAIRRVFGERYRALAVSSTKSMTGHLLGAAGGVEAAYTVLALKNGVLPPTINYETADPDCDLDTVPNKARAAPIEVALSNSFGFGGANASLVFGKHEA